MLDQIAWMAAAQRGISRTQLARDDVLRQRRIEIEPLGRTVIVEDGAELLWRRRLRQHFVLNTAEEGLVDEVARLEVRCKHDKDRERQLELLAGVQRQEVDPAFERNNPA